MSVGLTPVAVAVDVAPPPAPCVTTVTGPGTPLSSGAGSGTVTVTSTGTCPWRVESLAAWITVNATGRAGLKSGNDVMGFTVQANPLGTPRTGTLRVLDKEITVTQAAGSGGTCLRRGPGAGCELGTSGRETGTPVTIPVKVG